MALVASSIAMTVPMGFMSIIPTYESSSLLATVLLIMCFLVSGFSLGGGERWQWCYVTR